MSTAIFNCKKCRVGKRIDYPERQKIYEGYGRYSTKRYRIEGARQLTPHDDSTCPQCQKFMTWNWLQGFVRPEIQCDARCMGARGHSCDCSCGGKNHGAGWQIGRPPSSLQAA